MLTAAPVRLGLNGSRHHLNVLLREESLVLPYQNLRHRVPPGDRLPSATAISAGPTAASASTRDTLSCPERIPPSTISKYCGSILSITHRPDTPSSLLQSGESLTTDPASALEPYIPKSMALVHASARPRTTSLNSLPVSTAFTVNDTASRFLARALQLRISTRPTQPL